MSAMNQLHQKAMALDHIAAVNLIAAAMNIEYGEAREQYKYVFALKKTQGTPISKEQKKAARKGEKEGKDVGKQD